MSDPPVGAARSSYDAGPGAGPALPWRGPPRPSQLSGAEFDAASVALFVRLRDPRIANQPAFCSGAED